MYIEQTVPNINNPVIPKIWTSTLFPSPNFASAKIGHVKETHRDTPFVNARPVVNKSGGKASTLVTNTRANVRVIPDRQIKSKVAYVNK